ncbi:hypothetical protein [Kitasatospora sp. NPDC056800]|uniref:hypothetical protein n=1 Tax=Kitasatospora sp. NPDC056800 TaxID=3345948 RepID=UPI00367D5ABF
MQIENQFTTQAGNEVLVLTDCWMEAYTWHCRGCNRRSDATTQERLDDRLISQQAKEHADQCTVTNESSAA